MSTLLSVQGLHAGYGRLPVVRDLTMEVRAGEIVALLGPNGAGKTTTLLTISGLLPPVSGSVRALGFDIASIRRPEHMARRGLCHVPEGRAIFSQLTVRDNLRLGSRSGRDFKSAVKSVFAMFPELEPLVDRRAGLLSGGEQQMLALGRALAGRPRLLMVDEMSLGLAPILVQRLLPRLARIAKTGCGVLLVEQHVQQALGIADRAYVLAHGDVVSEGTAAELTKDPALLQSTYMGQKSLEPVVGSQIGVGEK